MFASRRRRAAAPSLSGALRHRKPHLKVRFAGMRIDPDIAPMLADNPVRRVESEARAFTYLLSRKEGIEDAALDLRRNTGAVVDDVDECENVVSRGVNCDLRTARFGLFRQRIDRVVDELVQTWLSSLPLAQILGNVRSYSRRTLIQFFRSRCSVLFNRWC